MGATRPVWVVNGVIIRSAESERSGLVLPLSDVNKVYRNRCRGGHGWRHEVRPAPLALTAFEVAVAGAGATLARLQLVGIHRQAHAAAGLAPVKSCFLENLVEPLCFRLLL